MLEIQNVETLKGVKLNIQKRRTKKTQIFLYDTKRRINPFLNMLKYRRNGKYENIPHFIITKTGQVYQIFDPVYYSKTFGFKDVDKRLIKIAIENLGWLKKNTITGVLNNWINEPFRGQAHIEKWRDHYFWDVYTTQQINSLKSLTLKLSKDFDIPYQSVNTSAYVKNAYKIDGIVCKSNFQTIYKDINPSFNYKIFDKNGEEIIKRI